MRAAMGVLVFFMGCTGTPTTNNVSHTNDDVREISSTLDLQVTADEAFSHYHPVDVLNEGIQFNSTTAPSSVTVTMEWPDTGDSQGFLLMGTVAAGTYEFEVVIDHYLDGPSDHETIDVTITAQ
jgi:hypothetical protein